MDSRIVFFRHILIMTLMLLCVVSSIFTQQTSSKTRVAVIPFVNQDQDKEESDILCTAVTDTVRLTINLLGSYELKPVPFDGTGLDPYASPELLDAVAEKGGLENIIFGKAYTNEAGNIVFQGSVYDTVTKEIVLTHEEIAPSMLATFDAADNLIIALMEGFSGTRIGFGAVRFENTGLQSTYQVYVDGALIGSDLKELEKVLNGERRIEIRQDRMLGEELIHEEVINIEEYGRYDISFALPSLIDKEQEAIEVLYEKVEAWFFERNRRQDVEAAFTRLDELFDDFSFNPTLEYLRDDKKERYRAWQLQKEFWEIEAAAADGEAAPLDETARLYAETRNYNNAQEIHRLAYRNAAATANMLMLKSAYEFSFNRWEEGTVYLDQVKELTSSIPSDDYFGFKNEIDMYTVMLNRYRTLAEKGGSNLGWWLAAGGGIGLTGTAAGLWISGLGNKINDQNQELYALYQNATNPETAEYLHNQITSNNSWANAIEYTKWGTSVIGPGLLTLGSIMLIKNSNAEEKYLKASVRDIFGARMETARQLFDRDTIPPSIIVCSSGGQFFISGREKESGISGGVTPVIFPIVGNDVWDLVGRDEWYGNVEVTDYPLHDGLNIVVLPADGEGGSMHTPTHFSELVVATDKGKQYTFTWEELPGAIEYSIQISEVEGDYVYVLDETDMPEYSWKLPRKIEVPLRARISAVNENGNFSPWSEWVELPTKPDVRDGVDIANSAQTDPSDIPMKHFALYLNPGGFIGMGPEVGIAIHGSKEVPWLEAQVYFRLSGLGFLLNTVYRELYDGDLQVLSFDAGMGINILPTISVIIPHRLVFGLELGFGIRNLSYSSYVGNSEQQPFLILMGTAGYRWRFKSGLFIQAGIKLGMGYLLGYEDIYFHGQTDAIIGIELF